MWIIYIISVVLIFIGCLKIQKTPKKQNLLFWMAITTITFFCYNTFVCYTYSLIHIPCNLITLSIFNFIVTGVMTVKIVLTKKVQKYNRIRKRDIVFCIVLFITVGIVAKMFFKCFPFELNYESTDPATHYTAAREFYNNHTLLNNMENTTIFDLKQLMPISYVNTGIAFFIGENFLEDYQFYNIYVLIDLIVLYMSGILFYSLLIKRTKSIKMSIIAMIISILYILAYTLNSMIFGFAYLSVGLNVIIAILAIIQLKKDTLFNKHIWNIIMFMLNFGLFFGYYLFMPIIYLAEGIYMIMEMIKNRNNKTIICKENIVQIIVTLILPTIMGIAYFIIPSFNKNNELISTEGYIYRELYANFLIMIPFVIFFITRQIKNKRNDIFMLTLIIGMAFTLILFIVGVAFNKVSSYYFYKMHYLLYILSMYATFESIYYLWENKDNRIFIGTAIGVLLCCLIFNILNIDEKIGEKSTNFNPVYRMNGFFPIYTYNLEKMNPEKTICTSNMLDIIYYYGNNIKEDRDSVMVKGNNRLQRWMYALFGITHHSNYLEFSEENIWNTTEDWILSGKKYLIAFYEEELNLDNQDKYEVILKNEDGCILKRK